MNANPSAVLFAKDFRRVSRFYVGVFGAIVRAEDEHHAALDVLGMRLVVHGIPAALAADIEIRNPPVRRESAAIRLDYPVADLAWARSEAARLDGQIDEESPAWAGPHSRFRLGFDPEGNVFGVADAWT